MSHRKTEARQYMQRSRPAYAKAGDAYVAQRKAEEVARSMYAPEIDSLGVTGVAPDGVYYRPRVALQEESSLVPGSIAGQHAVLSFELTEEGPQTKKSRWGLTYYSVPPIEVPNFDHTDIDAMKKLEWQAWAQQAIPHIRAFIRLWEFDYALGGQQAFIADELCRAIEKQRDSCETQGRKWRAEIEGILRGWNGTEIEITQKEKAEGYLRMYQLRWKSLDNMLDVLLEEREHFATLANVPLDKYMPLKEKAANTRLRKEEKRRAAVYIGMTDIQFERQIAELKKPDPVPDFYDTEVPVIRTSYADARQQRLLQDYWGSQHEVDEHNRIARHRIEQRKAKAAARARRLAAKKEP